MSVPVQRSYRNIRNEMIEKVNNKEYLLGELVEPKTHEKFVLTADGSVVKKTFTTEARRIPLKEIRERLFTEHKKKGKL